MAKKTILLVRHGQYLSASAKSPEKLTALGRRQAKLVGQRLKEVKINTITYSTMPRAIETATLIKKELKYSGQFKSCDLVRECVPGFPKKLRKKYGFTDEKKLIQNEKQVARAFRKHFKVPTKNSVEVIVCHGNVIRYLVCRSLGIDTLNWRLMDIQQCGISIIEVRSKDPQRVLISHNDIGHIPKKDRTFL